MVMDSIWKILSFHFSFILQLNIEVFYQHNTLFLSVLPSLPIQNPILSSENKPTRYIAQEKRAIL